MIRSALLALAAAATAGAAAGPAPDAAARFEWIDFRVDGGNVPEATAGKYRNPVLPGFHSDPAIVRVGRDFYLVTSTFGWYPGIPVFHSRDLVHWRQIGNAISRPGQLRFDGLGMSQGVFAASISFHAGRFYVVNTCVGCGGNYVVTATDPAGPWSDPVWLPDVGGIDPSIFFDADDRAWIVNNDEPPGKPRYSGHRAIWLHRFDWQALRTVGAPRLLVDAGVDPAAEPSWIEGPHLYRREGRYYLMAAEGGTGPGHSEVVFSSAAVDGPYRPAPPDREPILTQRDLDPRRAAPVTSAGHADLVDIGGDRWWAVFLATRPYRGDLYNTGRETFLLPVTWSGGWPTILPKGVAIPADADAPPLPADGNVPAADTGRDDFAGPGLSPAWMMMRTPSTAWYRIGGGALRLDARPVGIGDRGNPSFLGRRQAGADETVTTQLRLDPAEGASAGLAAVQNDEFFLTGMLTRRGGRARLEVRRRAGRDDPAEGREIAAIDLGERAPSPLLLRLRARGGAYDFDWAGRDGRWRALARDVDGTNLSTQQAGGFVGTLIGPYAYRAPATAAANSAPARSGSGRPPESSRR